jgi:predicted site-specific integrase-resolvase
LWRSWSFLEGAPLRAGSTTGILAFLSVGDSARIASMSSEMTDQTDPAARPARAVLYLRVSTAKQAKTDLDPEGLSLPAQRESCLRKAEELGAEVVDEYVDRGESAKTANRPQFRRMVERVQTDRDIDYVILDKINRFARNRRDDANMLFELRSAVECQEVV